MSVESDICVGVVSVVVDNAARFTMLGTSAALHVESADDVDTTIVRGGQGRCLVRPGQAGAQVEQSHEASALVMYPIELSFEVYGGGGQRSLTRSAVQSAVISAFGEGGAALMTKLNSQTNRLGRSGNAFLDSVQPEPSEDPRKPRMVATLAVRLWHNIPEA